MKRSLLLYCFADLLRAFVGLPQGNRQVFGAVGVQQGDLVHSLVGHLAGGTGEVHHGALGPGLEQLLEPLKIQLL